MKPALVWDLPTRLFHWLLAAGCLAAFGLALAAPEHSRAGHYYRVMEGTTLLAASPSLADENFSFVPNAPAVNSGTPVERYATAVGPAGEPVRLLRYHYRAFGSSFDITLAESLSDGLAMVATFRYVLLIGLPCGILLLTLTTWWITRRGLEPLARFSATIETITHQNLGERLDTGRTARELTRLSSSFNAMLDRLHHVFESQKRLVADASHEMKTPLTVIRTQCDVALQQKRSPEEYVTAIQTVRSETGNITRLVNDLLSMARLDAGLVVVTGFAPVSISKLAEYAVRLSAPIAAELQVRVTVVVDGLLWVRGVRSSLEEALLNLVENAVRYNRVGGEVRITASSSESGQVAITVSDSGIGISPADQERIFERFFRAAAVRNHDGSGLGLSIVKAIIEGHGGRVLVASEPSQGSSFTLLLPAAQPDGLTVPESR